MLSLTYHTCMYTRCILVLLMGVITAKVSAVVNGLLFFINTLYLVWILHSNVLNFRKSCIVFIRFMLHVVYTIVNLSKVVNYFNGYFVHTAASLPEGLMVFI